MKYLILLIVFAFPALGERPIEKLLDQIELGVSADKICKKGGILAPESRGRFRTRSPCSDPFVASLAEIICQKAQIAQYQGSRCNLKAKMVLGKKSPLKIASQNIVKDKYNAKKVLCSSPFRNYFMGVCGIWPAKEKSFLPGPKEVSKFVPYQIDP